MLPENAPVRLLSAQLEELEYGKLYEAYSSKGRKSAAEPRVLFKVLVHGYLWGSIPAGSWRRPVIPHRLQMAAGGPKSSGPQHTGPVPHRDAARKQWRTCSTSLSASWRKRGKQTKAVFLDGTKLESRAGRYTFVWRKSVEKQLARIKERLKILTGLTTSAEVRSLQEEEAGGDRVCQGHG